MQSSHDGEVELSVTLSTKGLKSDVQKIKEEINSAVGSRSGKGIQLIDEKQLARQVSEATSKVSKSKDATITITPEVDESKLNAVRDLFLKASGFNEGAGWEVSRDAINNYLSAYMALSDTEMDVHRQWLADNMSMIQSNENAAQSIRDIQEAISQINVADVAIDVQQVDTIEGGTIHPDVYVDPAAVEEALGDANPQISPSVIIPEDKMAEAIDGAGPVLQFTDENSFYIDGGALQRSLNDLALTLHVEVDADSGEVKEEAEEVGQDILDAIRRMHEREQEAIQETMEAEPVQPVPIDWDALHAQQEQIAEEMKQFGHQTEQVNQEVEQSTQQTIDSEIGNYDRFIDYIYATEEKAEELAERMAELRDVGIEPEEMAKLQQQYDTLVEKIALMRQNIDMGSTAWEEMTPPEQLQMRIERMAEQFQEMGETMIDRASQALRTFGQRIANVGRGIVRAGIDRLTNGFRRLGPAIHQSTQGLKMGFKNLLAYAIGIRGLFAVFGKLRSAITEGVKNLAQWNNGNNEVNKNISLLQNSLGQLKNSLGSAFAPILTVITPALNTLIQYVIQACNAIAQLMALISGASTWKKATQLQNDYAKSLKGAGGAAKGALAAFDDLDVLEKNAGGGGSGVDPNQMFEEVPIEGWAKDWLDKLKKMWEEADFTELGATIGEKLKAALDSIPWDGIKEVAAKIGKSIATLINGFVEVDGLGETIGKTLAEVFNTAFTFLYNFVTNLHWASIGKFIGEALLGFIDTIDAALIGSTLGETLKGIITTAFTMLQTFMEGGGFTKLGEKISEVINNFFARMNEINPDTMLNAWQMLGQTLTNAIHGLFTTVITALEQTDWSQIGKAITDAITSIDFKKLSMDFTNLVTAIKDAVCKFVESVDWLAVGESIGDMVAGIDLGSIAMDLTEMAWTIVKALAEALFGLVDSINTNHPIVMSIVAIIAAAIAAVQLGLIPAAAITALRSVIVGIFGALGTIGVTLGSITILGIGTAILGFNLGAWIGNAIQKAFGNEPVEVSWDAIFGDKEALAEGLKLWWDDIFDAFLTIGNWEAELVQMGIDLLKGLWQGMCDWQAELKAKWDKFWYNVIDWFASIFGIHSPSTVFADFGGMIIQGLIEGINNLLQSLYGVWTDIKNGILGIVGELASDIDTLWQGIKATAEDWWNKIKDALAGAAGILVAIKNAVIEKVEELRKKIESKWTEVKNNVTTKWTEIKTALENKCIEIRAKVWGKVEEIRDGIIKRWEDLKGKTEKKFGEIRDKLVDIWKGVKDKIKEPINKILSFIEGFVNKIIGGINFLIEKLNALKVEVPKGPWGEGFTFGVNLEPLKEISITPLAQGGVIPPNHEFLAMLGDQKYGTNIEAPLDTIKEAFADVVGNMEVHNTGSAVMQVDGRTFARVITPYVVSELERRGYNVAIMEA